MTIPAELTDVALFGSTPRFGDMMIHAVIDLRRSFDRAALVRAAEGAIAAFPVLGRRYEPRFFRDRWAPVPGPAADAVHVVEDAPDLEAATRAFIERPIVATRDRPFRIVSLPRGSGSRLLISISHLAVDGAGVGAVGHVIGAHLYGVSPALPVDTRRHARSTLGGLKLWHLPALARDLADAAAKPLAIFAAARRERPYPQGLSRALIVRRVVVEAPDLARLKASLAAQRATVNDALVAALARAAAARSTGGPVVVLYTMDLRRYAAAPRLRAANISTILSVVVPRRALSDPAETTRAVARITARHRATLAGPASLLAPLSIGLGSPHGLLRRVVPLLHPILVDLPLSRGLLVTNVGRLDDGLGPFGADIEDLRVVGPNVTGISVPLVVAFGFRGALHLEVFGAPGLSEDAVRDLEGEIRRAFTIEGGAS